MPFGFGVGFSPEVFLAAYPTLQLYFAGSTTLDSRITFTRADAVTCATYFDSTGRLQTAAANVARFDYDPATPAGVTGGELATTTYAARNANGTIATAGTAVTSTCTVSGQFGVNVSTATPTLGKTYLLSVSVTAISRANTLYVDFGGVTGNFGTTVGAKTTYIAAISGTTVISITQVGASIGDTFTIDNISVKEVTFTPRGLLIEESRQNLLLQSRDMTTASWTKSDVTPTRNQVGIDGTANSACLMTEGSAGTASTRQTSTVTAGSTCTVSYVFKRGNTDWVRIALDDNGGGNIAQAWFNLNTGAKGTITVGGTFSGQTSSITSYGGGWYRVTLSGTPSGVYTTARYDFSSANADNSTTRVSGATYIVDCAQLEVGAFATSIIPTTTTALVRASDSASMTGTNFSSWFNASAGTFVVEALTSASGSRGVLSVNDGTSNNKTDIRIGTGAANFCSVGGVSQTNLGAGLSAGVVNKVAYAQDTSNRYLSANGGSAVSVASSIPTVNSLQLGGFDVGTSFQLNGYLRSLRYYNTRLPNATLQSLTA